jgi:hypothetical protein
VLWQVRFPPPKKTDRRDIPEKLLKLALNTIIMIEANNDSTKNRENVRPSYTEYSVDELYTKMWN